MKVKVAIVVALIGPAIGVLVITSDSALTFNDSSLVATTKSKIGIPSHSLDILLVARRKYELKDGHEKSPDLF